MSLDPALRERIAGILASHRVVLFMKGTRAAPRCGFSAGAVGTLDGLLEAYHDIDVLADADLREGIKAYGNWPTIPQLYIGGELVGGSDIIQQLAGSGDDRVVGLRNRIQESGDEWGVADGLAELDLAEVRHVLADRLDAQDAVIGL